VAHPVGLVAAAAIAPRTSLAAPTSVGSVRLGGLVSSPQRFAARLYATWLASSAGISRWRTSPSIWPPLTRGCFGQDAGSAGNECLDAGHPDQIGRIRIVGQGAVRLNLPGSQGRLEPCGGCRFSHLVRVG
jgi:hypothetical protein